MILKEDARNLRGLKVVVDRLTLELATVLAKSILESRTLVELEVELEYGKRHSLEKKEIYSELLAAVERNQSGLRTCVVQVENYSMASEETNRDAIRIKEICEQRMQEYLQAGERKESIACFLFLMRENVKSVKRTEHRRKRLSSMSQVCRVVCRWLLLES